MIVHEIEYTMESKEELTAEELKKKAYLMGLRLKNSGLDAETIYARLEKQGIPEELARQVAKDTLIERKREVIKETLPLLVLSEGISADSPIRILN
jgi:coproporphyrinogen III oxidase-like Fe-S oxidoreductase